MKGRHCAIGARAGCASAAPWRARAGLVHGFTMIELLVTIAIAAILAGLAAPSFRALIVNNRLKSHTSALHTSLLQARSEAIKRNSRVVLCKSADGASCAAAGDWQQGWIIFADANDNAAVDAGEAVLQKVPALSGEFVLKGSGDLASYVSYSSTGAPKLKASDNPQTGVFSLCQLGVAGGGAREVELFATGRVTVAQTSPATCAP
jgi:type IV fimbrial biogenesis protein FimT